MNTVNGLSHHQATMKIFTMSLLLLNAFSLWLSVCRSSSEQIFVAAFQTKYHQRFTIHKDAELRMKYKYSSSDEDYRNDRNQIFQKIRMENKKKKLAIASFISFFASRSFIPPATATVEKTVKEDVTTVTTQASPNKFKLGSKFSVAMAGTSAIIVGGAVMKRGKSANVEKDTIDEKKKEFESIIGIQTPVSIDDEVEINEEISTNVKTEEPYEQNESDDNAEPSLPDVEEMDQEVIEKAITEEEEIEEKKAKIKAAAVAKTIAEATERAKKEAKRKSDEVKLQKTEINVEEPDEVTSQKTMINIKEQFNLSEEKPKEVQNFSEEGKKTEVEDDMNKAVSVDELQNEDGGIIDLEKGEENLDKNLPLSDFNSPAVTDEMEQLTSEGNEAGKSDTDVEILKDTIVKEIDLEEGETSEEKNLLSDSKDIITSENDDKMVSLEEESKDLGEKAFNILLDLGMIERSRDPDDINYDHSDDNEYV